MWDDCHAGLPESFPPQYDQESFTNFDLFTTATKFKDYYKTLEVDYDATDDDVRANYIRLALYSYLWVIISTGTWNWFPAEMAS
ncbi:hypothetical protein Csa_021959 [Cucumis sativus]|nr:hypothetical protein Csa_021959 [Cucumis sativus]